MKYQIVEKDGYGTDWAAVRYNAEALTRFDSEEEAEKVAIIYLTDINCKNALAKSEKLKSAEAFMMRKDGCFLGVLDGEDWYMKDRKGNSVTDRNYFELEGKTEVSVRVLPGT